MNFVSQNILLKNLELKPSLRLEIERRLEGLRDQIPMSSSLALSLWRKDAEESDIICGSLRVKTLKKDFLVKKRGTNILDLTYQLEKEMRKELHQWKKQRFKLEKMSSPSYGSVFQAC